MNISYDHYKVFYYVAKYGSFTKASSVLFSNQPNLTRTVKTLESQLGCTLFIRSNKGVKLTADGEKLYEHISIAFEHIQAGEAEISLNKSLQKGIVSIGASEIALRCFLLPILNQFHQQYPGIRIKIANVSTPQALSMLKNNLVDLAIVTTPLEVGTDLTKIILKDFDEVAICGDAFSKLSKTDKPMSLHEISQYPIISLGPKTSTFEFYLHNFLTQGCTFSPDIEAATADQIIPLVQHNLGISFVPKEFLNNDSTEKGIHQITLTEPIPQRSICLLKNKARTFSLPAKELEKMILEKDFTA